jgi:hypothetical protein
MNGANEIDTFINSKQAMRITLMIYFSCICNTVKISGQWFRICLSMRVSHKWVSILNYMEARRSINFSVSGPSGFEFEIWQSLFHSSLIHEVN